MSNNPTHKELKYLMRIADYFRSYQEFPSNRWLGNPPEPERLDSDQEVSNVLRRLRQKGFITEVFGQSRLSDQVWAGLDSLGSTEEATSPLAGTRFLELPLCGTVRAGRQEAPVVDLSEPDPETERMLICGPEDDLRLLLVEGESMEHEHIFAGDYVLVKPVNKLQFFSQGDLVVARYVEVGKDPTEVEYEGPTLKYYYQEEHRYRLSWQTEHAESEFTIMACAIEPEGKVVGMYRPIGNRGRRSRS